MNLSAYKEISAEERAKRFADGRCLYSGGFNPRAAECVAWKRAQELKAAGAQLYEVATWPGSDDT